MTERPNLIFIMPDQLRADFLGCYGADFNNTPNIDSLAQHGVLYERAISTHPLCVPARCSLLTGMNGIKTGVLDNGQFLRPDYSKMGIRLWPEILAESGYYTAAIGKMHFYPWDARMGFQYRSIAEDKRWIYIRDDYYQFLKERGYRKYHGKEHEGYFINKGAIINRLPWECSVDHFVGQQAVKFIDVYGVDGPFAMMVGFPGPHCPYDPNPEFLEKIDPSKMPKAIPEVEGATPQLRQNSIQGNLRAWNGVDYTEFTSAHKRKIRAHYAASVQQIDYEIGKILEKLEEKGLLENTIIIFSADHGDYLGDHNLIGKGTFFETGIHIPLLVCAPGMKEGVKRDDKVILTDVMPTLLAYAGCDIPSYVDAVPLPGLNLPGEKTRDHIIGITQGGWMIDDGTFKLVLYATDEHCLFNLTKDPTEQNNLYKDPALSEIKDQMESELLRYVMQSMRASQEDRRVYTNTLSQQPEFGREGWRREYPRKLTI
jgi:arylsulfatase A-like enzyme